MTPLERAVAAIEPMLGWGADGDPPINIVRAVLNAIREPSDKVAIATASKVFDISSAQDEIDMGASCWRAGIDAMLEEG
ncbi:hypothetical protein [Sphingobium yanoikuyae]|uniref:hypothetical protein n=1 Tax=Sphingobium yanoikuyae TaxID=13690 RepID=UPI0028AC9E74|nr:hypothetical protein [Sphingobium yanoikuyae]